MSNAQEADAKVAKVGQASIKVAKDFSEIPGPRFRREGDWSGEKFLEEMLGPRFKQALGEGCTLLVDLDGTQGYATSFLEASFGGLAREFGPDVVLAKLKLKSLDEPYLESQIRNYIKDARA